MAGDPIAHVAQKQAQENLYRATLEVDAEQLAHELLPDEQRQELRDRVIRLQRKLSH